MTRTFKESVGMKGFLVDSKDGNDLIVIQVGKSIVLELPHLAGKKDYSQQVIKLSTNAFKTFYEKLKELAEITWGNIEPKEATSEASDYYEYYDKELDNNGYFSFNVSKGCIQVTQVYEFNSRVYKFNKRKMQSLLFDLEEEVIE